MLTPRRRTFALGLVLLLTACGGSDEDDFQAPGDASDTPGDTGVDGSDVPDAPPNPVCGDGVIDTGEECDGAALNSMTCPDIGDFVAGSLGCTDSCTFDTSACEPESAPTCGDGTIEAPEECEGDDLNQQTCADFGFEYGDLSCGADCLAITDDCRETPVCGDGVEEGDEECDDGNLDDGDGCDAECLDEDCGDGIVQTGLGEECDTGSVIVADCMDPERPVGLRYCSDTCVFEDLVCPGDTCGDSVIDPGEACDDGNDMTGDGCTPECVSETCGDGTADSTEACDGDDLGGFTCADFGFNDGAVVCDACAIDFSGCFFNACGDGSLGGSEECDDGNREDGDGCSRRCRLESCGDGTVAESEECDDGVDNSDTAPDACRTDCTSPVCGDGVTDTDEDCDDGADNTDTAGSGECRTDCTLAECGDGIVDADELCDDGTDNSDMTADACRTTCVPASCGDGIQDTGEECDDGGLMDRDGCSALCETEIAPVIESLSATPSAGNAPLAVTFDALATDPDGTVVGYSWEFGDGGTGTGASVMHTYTTGGVYDATVTFTDDDGFSEMATIAVDVNSVPMAGDDMGAAGFGQTITIDVLANDTDADMDTLMIDSVTTPVDGSAAIVGGAIEYTAPSAVLTDTFSYTISDGRGGGATAFVSVDVFDPCALPAGADRIWIGGDTNWTTATNWVPSGIPANSDDLVICGVASSMPLIRGVGRLAGSLVIQDGATLRIESTTGGSGALTVTGDVTNDGTIITEGATGRSAQLVSNGTITSSSTGLIRSEGQSASFTGAFVNDGTFEVASSRSVTWNLPTGAAMEGAGEWRIASNDLILNQTGTAIFSPSGSVEVAAGRTLSTFGDAHFNGTTITGAGRIEMALGLGRAVRFSTDYTNTETQWRFFGAGEIRGPGVFTQDAAALVDIHNMTVLAPFVNRTTTQATGTTTFSDLTNSAGATLRIQATGTTAEVVVPSGWVNEGDVVLASTTLGFSAFIDSAGTITNAGSIGVPAGSASGGVIESAVVNQGVLYADAQALTLQLFAESGAVDFVNEGTVRATGGDINVRTGSDDRFVIRGDIEIGAGHAVNGENGDLIYESGTLSGGGLLRGCLRNSVLADLVLDGVDFEVLNNTSTSGSATIFVGSGRTFRAGGTIAPPIDNAGTIIVSGGTSWNGGYAGQAGSLLSIFSSNDFDVIVTIPSGFSNFGTIELEPVGLRSAGVDTLTGDLTNEPSGVINVRSGLGTGSLNGTLINNGTVQIDEDTSTDSVVNGGQITVGAVTVTGRTDGVLQLDPGSTLNNSGTMNYDAINLFGGTVNGNPPVEY